jgi:hypothetical protein
MRFEKSGQYRIMQAIINDFQGDGEDLEATPTAYINVIDATNDSRCSEFASSDVNILELMFTPGMGGSSNDIPTAEVSNQVSVNFEVQSQKDRFPVRNIVLIGLLLEFLYSRTRIDFSLIFILSHHIIFSVFVI